MYCKKCGKELPDDANFCIKCGAPQNLHESMNTEKEYLEFKQVYDGYGHLYHCSISSKNTVIIEKLYILIKEACEKSNLALFNKEQRKSLGVQFGLIPIKIQNNIGYVYYHEYKNYGFPGIFSSVVKEELMTNGWVMQPVIKKQGNDESRYTLEYIYLKS